MLPTKHRNMLDGGSIVNKTFQPIKLLDPGLSNQSEVAGCDFSSQPARCHWRCYLSGMQAERGGDAACSLLLLEVENN